MNTLSRSTGRRFRRHPGRLSCGAPAASIAVPSSADTTLGDTMEPFLVRMQEAAGVAAYARETSEWALRGTHEEMGVCGSLTLRFDRDGRFLRSSDSPLGTTEAFDGVRGWRIDSTGMPGAFELGDLAHAMLDVWVSTGIWLANPALLEVVSIAESESSDVALTIRIPGSPITASLVVDRETALPRRLEIRGLAVPVVREFHDYRDHGGVFLPHRLVRIVSGHVETRSVIEERTVVPTTDGAAFARVASPPVDSRFSAATGDVGLAFAPTGHLLVRPRINGTPTDAFIFDTGAGQSGVHTPPSSEYGLREVGQALVASIFGTSLSPVLRGAPLELGPLTLTDPLLMTMDLSPLGEFFGEPVGGVIGYDVLRRSVVELDLVEPRMRLHEPSRYELPNGEWIRLRFQDNHPLVPATVGGHEGLFRLDLGASGGPHGNVVFHSPAVRTLGLLEGRQTQEAEIGGQRVAVGSIDSFELAGVEFGETAVVFAQEEPGLHGEVHAVGSIGVELLRPFEIVFDYANERLALTRRH